MTFEQFCLCGKLLIIVVVQALLGELQLSLKSVLNGRGPVEALLAQFRPNWCLVVEEVIGVVTRWLDHLLLLELLNRSPITSSEEVSLEAVLMQCCNPLDEPVLVRLSVLEVPY